MPDQNDKQSRRENDLSAQAHSDDPRQAIESGEPRIAGHQGTRIIEDNEGADQPNTDKKRNPGQQAQ
jgi:hypothetical protein